MKTIIVILLVICLSLSAFTQSSVATKKVDEIVASFNKKKEKVKEKNGVRKEGYKEVRSQPAVKSNSSEYSGTYELSDLGSGYLLNIRVGTGGTVDGSGFEPLQAGGREGRQFMLRNARIEGALLTAEKVYADGAAEKFEGVFIERTVLTSPTDGGVSSFGLAVVGRQMVIGGITTDKLFYQLKK